MFQTYVELFNLIDTVNLVAILLSVITILVLVLNNEFFKPRLAQRTKIPIPIELIVVVGGVLLSKYLRMEETWEVIPVGHIPLGLPPPTMPNFSLWKELLLDSFAIAFVSYSVTVSMALIFGQKLKYEIDFNQELLAMVNIHVQLVAQFEFESDYSFYFRDLETFLDHFSPVFQCRHRCHDR